MSQTINNSLLGKSSDYSLRYEPGILFPVPRLESRKDLNCNLNPLPFTGYDIWSAYELSYLNIKGKPQCFLGFIIFPYNTENIIESKSLKLYLNSLSEKKFKNNKEFANLITKDLSNVSKGNVIIKIFTENDFISANIAKFEGTCLDVADIEFSDYKINKKLVCLENDNLTNETLYTNLFKSNCPVTGQPDWASVQVSYFGKTISRENLLRYLVSYRTHSAFHENCVENIFCDIMESCNPEKLTVYARFTRRGGLDINPIRTNDSERTLPCIKTRLFRQ
ncbi:MAG TPA: NADPH-dependent 7-cyano-7-deazaguanine reductase QueF [Lentisphaeria bacterium]|nr:MAG: NADPH-dependent 7-cyano-7-deazaguanine reductase QueF [Lentisphaerae bacterium GWF2_38_69]HBM15497.1 NADPH-dependent 7-cyano-7-deazaguanine reductase QueF [Lentisphaeria bacterium]